MKDSASYQVMVQEGVMVSMRDGVSLATDIFLPSKDGRPYGGGLPALLERTPYGKRDVERQERARFFTRHGYVVVLQDCRGCHSSEGDLYFLAQEPEDGYDTVEWIAGQPWCNGKVGTFGTSYMSWVQSALATQRPPHLACMFPNMGGWNAYASSVRQGGAFEMRFLAWAFWHSALNRQKKLKSRPWVDETLNNCDVRDWLTRMPIQPGETPLKLVPTYERWLFDIFTRSEYDDFWKQPGFAIEEYLDDLPDVPVHLSGGWYDSYTRSTLETFIALTRAKESAIKVVMGPWTHGTYTTELSYAGDVDLGPDAALSSFDQLHLRWFDRWLKNEANGVDREPPVHIFVMGGGGGKKTKEGRLDHGGCWRDEQEWPLARTAYTAFYLHQDGVLASETPGEASACSQYLFDPSRPVPTVGGSFSSLDYLTPPPPNVNTSLVPGVLRRARITPQGGFDQREGSLFFGSRAPCMPLASRPDVLVFQTKPLKDDVEVTGPIEVKLWVSSSARDTDFTAKLIDVYPPSEDYPDGYALNISDSILRMRYRESWSVPVLMEEGCVYSITITLYPTSNVFKKGHRIRLDVSSSNFPRFDVNPNTGEPLGKSRRTVVAENTVFHDRDHPSHITLPVIPA